MKHRNPVPTDRLSHYKVFSDADPENAGRFASRPWPRPSITLSFGRCDVTAGTADGGGIFRLVVSRFNELQRRCRLYSIKVPHTC